MTSVAIALLLLVSAFAATSSDAAPQGPWVLPAVDLSASGEDANGLESAVGPQGTVAVVWPRENVERSLAVRIRPPVGDFGPPIDIPGTGNNPNDEDVAVGPDGSVTVVWARDGIDQQQIQTSTRPPDGVFGPVESLSTEVEDAESPRIAIGTDGTTTVAWVRESGPDQLVEASTRPPDGSFGPAQDLSGAGDFFGARVAAGPDGSATVVWSASDTLGFIQSATRPAAAGSFAPAEDLSPTGLDAFTPDVATGPDGTTIAAWTLDDGFGELVQARVRPPGGAFGPAIALSQLEPSAQKASDARVAFGSDGTAAVVWSLREGPDDRVVQSSFRPPDGAFGAAQDVSDPDPITNQLPEVAVAPDSTVSVVWAQNGDSDQVIAASTRTPDSVYTEPEVLSPTTGESREPLVTVGPDGKATAVWTRTDGPDQIIQSASTETPTYSISLNKKGPGKGKVTSSPSGITCGNDCSGAFTSLSTVTLTAAPDPGNRFTGWTGPCTGSALTCVVFMDRDRTPSATFCPKRSLGLGKLTRNRKNGTAKLAFTGGGSGTVVLKSTKKVKAKSRAVGGKGTGNLSIVTKGKTLRNLKRTGRAKVALTITYKPGGGCSTVTRKRTVSLTRR